MSDPRKNKGIDPTHIWQAIFDEDSESIKVELLPLELAINLDAEGGDSVLALPQSLILEQGEADCKRIKSICLYGQGVVSVSPIDSGDEWYELAVLQLSPQHICARRIKLVGSGKLVMQSV
jgi:hypothetical protein